MDAHGLCFQGSPFWRGHYRFATLAVIITVIVDSGAWCVNVAVSQKSGPITEYG